MSSVINGFSYSPGTLESINNPLGQSNNSSTGSALGLSSLSSSLGSPSIGSLAMQSFASNQLLPQLQLSSSSLGNGNGASSSSSLIPNNGGFVGNSNTMDSLAGRRAITGAHNLNVSVGNKQQPFVSSSGSGSNMFKSNSAYNWSMANNTSGGLLSAQSIPIGGSGSSGGSAQSAGSPQSPIGGWNSGSPTSPLQLSQQSSLSGAGGWGAYSQLNATPKYAQSQNQFSRSNSSMVAPISPLKKTGGAVPNVSSSSSAFAPGLNGNGGMNSASMASHLTPQMSQQLVHQLSQQMAVASQSSHHHHPHHQPAPQQLMISPKYRGMNRSGGGNAMQANGSGSMSSASGNSPASNVMLMMGMSLAAQQAAVGNKMYDLGSVGSESATCSSGDSNGSSLRDNHNLLMNFQNNLGLSQMQNGVGSGPLDNMRFPLEQHLLEIMRSTSNESQHDNHYKGDYSRSKSNSVEQFKNH
jgi:hypothetical protein